MPMILHYLKLFTTPTVSAGRLNSDLNKIPNLWADKWSIAMNPVKSRKVVFSLKGYIKVHSPLMLDSNVVKDAESHTHLGLTLQSSTSWRNHAYSSGV